VSGPDAIVPPGRRGMAPWTYVLGVFNLSLVISEAEMDTYKITGTQEKQIGTWTVHYESADGPIEIKRFKHLSAAIRYGQWLASISPDGRLTVGKTNGLAE
jgi:hypothetical protein